MRLGSIALAMLLVACSNGSETSAPQKAAKPAAEAKSDADAEVKQAKKTLEEAAEAATKLVEEEARQEIQEVNPPLENSKTE